MNEQSSKTTHDKLLAHMRKRERQEKAFQTFLTDALKSPRLTQWEESFVSSLKQRSIFDGGCKTIEELSDRQKYTVRQIEKKIYASG